MLWCSKVNGVVVIILRHFKVTEVICVVICNFCNQVLPQGDDPDGSRRQQSAFDFVPSLVIIFFTPDKWTTLALRLISWLLVTFKSIEMFRVEGISSRRKVTSFSSSIWTLAFMRKLSFLIAKLLISTGDFCLLHLSKSRCLLEEKQTPCTFGHFCLNKHVKIASLVGVLNRGYVMNVSC